jgi:serine phosphatase RsbU (regulator of sigma subunit)
MENSGAVAEAEEVLYSRIKDRLRAKRAALWQWAQGPAADRLARLGPAPEQRLNRHLHVLDDCVQKAADGSLGICRICHGYVEPELLAMDYTSMICLSHYSEDELRRLEAELELSQAVQRALLPSSVPDISGVEMAAFSRPAQIVGGDYFDFVRFRDGAHGVAIGDVAGHGVAASLLMASLQTALRTFVGQCHSPAEVMQMLNRFLVHNVNFTTFTTLFLARFEPRTQRLTYANAGHNPPLLWRTPNSHPGELQWLDPTGAAIGLLEDGPYQAETVDLATDDVLLLYTDGVSEATNADREEFGAERLAGLVRGSSRRPAGEIVRNVREAVEQFGAGRPLADDTTILIAKINGQSAAGLTV